MSRDEKNRDEISAAVDSGVDLFTLVQDILRNWWVILLGALAGAMLTYVVTSCLLYTSPSPRDRG